tara:strand:+ start:19866 stop:20630 length:765 start_codon:yes stop_codon:yes gene_type:complete
MNIFEAIIIGLVQGLTEFLPISSSGHLVIIQKILKINSPGNLIEVSAHLGTLLSIILIYKKEIWGIITSLKSSESKKYIFMIVLATLPSVVFVLTSKSFIIRLFESVSSVAIALIFTGCILYMSGIKYYSNKKLSLAKGFLIGISQAFAIIPGISRSGMTISIALLLGVSSKEAAKFSFMLAVPAIFGATILTFLDAQFDQLKIMITPLVVTALVSFVSGLLALKFLIKILNAGKFYYFSFYCILIGLISLLFL